MSATTLPTPQDQLPLDPIWRQAAQEAVAAFRPGDTIPHAWIRDHLGVPLPDGPLTAAAFQRLQFQFLARVEGFKAELLTQHQRYLVNRRGEGYHIVPAHQQTPVAMTRLGRDLRKSVSSALDALIHIDALALSLTESRENAEARAKIGFLTALHQQQLRRADPPPPLSLPLENRHEHP